MAEQEVFSSGVVHGEAPQEQIEPFRQHARRLFETAQKRFGVEGSNSGRIGSAKASVLDHARYRAKDQSLVTISDSLAAPMPTADLAVGAISVTIETPLPQSSEFLNIYLRDTFYIPGFGSLGDYDHSMGVTEYSLEGEPVAAHTEEGVRRAYPKEMMEFQAAYKSRRFTDLILTLVQLKSEDEVGCEPNPYSNIL